MAAFGCFAGLATAGVGALCSYETTALNMFDFTAMDARSCNSNTFFIFKNISCNSTTTIMKKKSSPQQVSHCEASCPATSTSSFPRAGPNSEIVELTYSP